MTAVGAGAAPPSLPAIYLEAESAARSELDRPDHTALAQLLEMSVEACGQLVASTSDADNLAIREALPRAARITDPNTFVPIADYPPDIEKLIAAIEGTCPIMRRFAASQYFIDQPREDTSWAEQLPVFPANLVPDGDVIYVPYVEGDAANTTLATGGEVGVVIPPAAAGSATPVVSAVPFTVDQTHALDSLPVGSIAVKVPNATMVVDAPGAQTTQVPIGTDDVLHTLPEGAAVSVLAATNASGEAVKAVAVTLPANEFRQAMTFISTHVHAAVAAAWHFIQNAEAAVAAEVKKIV